MRRMQTSVAVLATLALIFLTVAVGAMQAQTYTVLHSFGSKAGDPFSPSYSGIIAQGRDGNLYTTAPAGGANNHGAVFKVTPAGVLSVVYSFSGPDGTTPYGGVTLGTDGNLYGTTYQGGANLLGTIFKVTPGGTLTTLHAFAGGAEGENSYAPPIQGTDGNWYGTTFGGGTSSYGTVYKLTTAGVLTTLYSFDNSHGNGPYDPLVQGSDGNFYGTTLHGGDNGYGEVFKITPSGALTVLHSFNVTDGGYPSGPLVQASDGFFYGTTEDYGSLGGGVLFKISAAGVFTSVHNMAPATDGEVPYDGILQASDGNFYGANGAGGTNGDGTIFKMTTKSVVSTLYNFALATGNSPQVVPLQHTNGILYGDTNQGGSGSVSPCTATTCGVFYSLNASLPAFVRVLPNAGKVGSKIGILGQGFSSSSVVKFNGVTVTTKTLTGTTFILATIPAGASDGYVTVTTGTTTLKTLKKFTVHNSWGAGAAMPTARAGGAIGVINGKIYVVSGETTGSIVGNNEIYNPTSNTWTTGASIPTPRYAPASAVVNGILYVMGGIKDSSQTPQSVVEAYNPATNTWSTKAPTPTAIDSVNAVVEGGLIYLVGGYANGARSALVQRYNPATDTWATMAPLTTAKSSSVLGLLGTTIVSAGGLPNTNTPSGDNEGYNAATNKWSALTADPIARNAGCGAAVNGQLYVTGGSTSGLFGSATAATESFNLSKNAWTTLAPAKLATIGGLPAVVSGQLYCFGGTDDGRLFTGSVFNNVQIYQP